MISYAQNYEDVLLARAFKHQSTGFYVDIGANDPIQDSITKHFFDQGWHGVNVEPIVRLSQALGEARPGDINLNLGLSNREGILVFYEAEAAIPGLSTFSSAEAAAHRAAGISFSERWVPVTTLARVCADHVRGPIDFMSIDVEGHEREVIEGGDWKRWRPRVVVIEATRPNTQIPTHEGWEELLLQADYHFATFNGINRFYVRVEDRGLLDRFRVPVNVFDGFTPFSTHALEGEVQRLRAEVELLRARLPGGST